MEYLGIYLLLGLSLAGWELAFLEGTIELVKETAQEFDVTFGMSLVGMLIAYMMCWPCIVFATIFPDLFS